MVNPAEHITELKKLNSNVTSLMPQNVPEQVPQLKEHCSEQVQTFLVSNREDFIVTKPIKTRFAKRYASANFAQTPHALLSCAAYCILHAYN